MKKPSLSKGLQPVYDQRLETEWFGKVLQSGPKSAGLDTVISKHLRLVE